MQMTKLSALSMLVASALAADCFGDVNNGVDKWADLYWDLRAKMCGNTDCAYQQNCTTSSSKALEGLAHVVVQASLIRQRSENIKGFKDCWTATENIINQCVYGEKKMSGRWYANDQLYQLNSRYA